MKASPKPSPRTRALLQWSAFGASALAGLTAGVLWAPASGRHVRTRMAARFLAWWHTVAGRWHLWKPWPLSRPARQPASPKAHAPRLALRPYRLLTAA